MNDVAEVLEPGATDLPDMAATWAQDLFALPPDHVLLRAQEGWHALKRNEWILALLFYRIAKEHLYGQYGSLTAWARHVLGKKSSGEVAKLREQGQWVIEGVPPHERAEIIECTSPKMLSEAGLHRLSKVDAAEAITLAKSGKTQKELRDAVHARLAGQLHLDSGEFRNLHREKITKEAYREFVEAENLVAFNCHTAHPTISEVITLMAAEVKTGFPLEAKAMLRVGQAVASWRLPDGPAPTDSVEVLSAAGERAILEGLVRCVQCKASNFNDLEGHHAIPRSHGGHDGPIVWLCRAHHEEITRNVEGSWREHLQRWIDRSDLPWLREAVTVWLAGRSLADC